MEHSKRKRETADSSNSQQESDSKKFKLLSEIKPCSVVLTVENCPSELSTSSNFRKYTKSNQKPHNITQNDPQTNLKSMDTFVNEDTCSSNSLQSFVSNDNSSDEDLPKNIPRRCIRKKGHKQDRGKKRFKEVTKNKIVTTQKLKTDELNKIQITMTTTEVVPDAKSVQERSAVLKNYIDSGKMTYRVMKRANFVIETVRQEKVIVDLTKLMKLIREDEQHEGYKAMIDKKSLMRLILKLSRDGYIKFRKATLKSDSKEKCVCFICDPNIEDDHSVIISALEQSKMKFFISTKGTKNKEESMLIEEKDIPKDSQNIVKFIALPVKAEPAEEKEVNIKEYKYDRNAHKIYGLCPKFIRTRIIHELLFYLIHEHTNQAPITDREDIERVFHEFGYPEDVFENDRISSIFHRELNWKLFVPPLPVHESWPLGWTLVCDILLRLPLSIFLKCFNVPYIIPDIDYYMNHPIRKYYLVKNLPPKIRNGLMHGRRYIFAMHEILTRLCYMGLIQFGPQKLKEKDQVFIYLNIKTSLYNTVTSPAGYHEVAEMEYEKRQYVFKSTHDVEAYWYELWTVCINTNLGTRNSLTGQFIVLEQANTKPALMEACKPHLIHEVEKYDNGSLPGDGRGAAGLDSALFAHLKRNWNWSDLLTYPEKQKITQEYEERNQVDPVLEKPKKTVLDTSVNKKVNKVDQKNKKYKVKAREVKRKRIVRQILPKKKLKAKKPIYDEKDQQCLKKMSKLRTDWTQIEDNVLLLCKVASLYLCPNHRRQNVEYTIMRDVLHKMVPYSNAKTSRTCQRRILYIMKNLKTRRSVNMCFEEIKQDEFVSSKFGSITKKYHMMIIPTETLNIAFVELVIYMNQKFSNLIPTTRKPLPQLPDNIEYIKRMYDITNNNKKIATPFKDIETLHDVHFDVVRSVIHSSLCCSRDKTSWAFQLFKIYQQYPEVLLRSVISKLRHEQMVSIKKKLVKRTGSIPFPSPFQLSISYAYQLQNTRFNFTFYTEANAFLRSLLTWVNDPEINQNMEITMSDNGTSMVILDILDKLNFEFKFDHPEQVIVLDPVITNDVAYERIVKRYNEILKDPTRINFWEEQNKDDDEDYPEFDNEVKTIDLNSSMIRRSSTRIAFHMMRAEMCEGVDKNSAQHIHDYFVVNASRVFLKVSENDTVSYDFEKIQNEINTEQILTKIKHDAVIPDNPGKITSEIVKIFFSEINITNYDFEYIEKIKCFVLEKGELGVVVDELKTVEPDSKETILSLKNVLDLLVDVKIVLRVGTVTPRFVHFDYKTPWIVKADKIVRLDKEKLDPKEVKNNKWKGKKLIKNLPLTDETQSKVKLLVAPWIRLDGSLNRRVFDRWLGCLISIIMEEPGICLLNLTKKFDYLKPVETMYLLEILINLKCVSLIKLNKPKVTLFSKEPDFDFEDATILDEPKEVMIEPSQDIMYKFAVFMGQKSYSTNFID